MLVLRVYNHCPTIFYDIVVVNCIQKPESYVKEKVIISPVLQINGNIFYLASALHTTVHVQEFDMKLVSSCTAVLC